MACSDCNSTADEAHKNDCFYKPPVIRSSPSAIRWNPQVLVGIRRTIPVVKGRKMDLSSYNEFVEWISART